MTCFGAEARASSAVDVYLNRMEKVLRIKQLAIETGEKTYAEGLNNMVKALIEYTAQQTLVLIEEARKKAEENKQENK